MQCMECASGGAHEFSRLDLRMGIGMLAIPPIAQLDSCSCTT